MISIIMPLYNAECFLEEALQSIENQTLRNYELICINDGSTDKTVEIVNKAIQIDKRIKLLHNETRCGAAVSRNKGIKAAKGEYIIFLDGDDIFEEEMLEILYNCAKKEDLDIAICEFLYATSENIYMKRKVDRSSSYKKKFCEKPFRIYDVGPLDYIQWSSAPGNKLYKKEFIDKYNIWFQSLSCCNDVYFVEMAYMLAERILFLNDERVMIYVREHSVPSRISYNRDLMCAYAASKKILESLLERQMGDQAFKYSYLKIYQMFLNELLYAKTEKSKVDFYEFLHSRGIEELIKTGGNSFCDCLEKDNNYLSKFVKQEYETKWFENENIVSTILRANENKIWELWNQYKNISVWGVGVYGKSLLKLIDEKGLTICSVIDGNPKKEGMQIGKYVVQHSEKTVFSNIELVVVAIKGGYSEVKEKLKQYNVIVININEYL